MSSPTNQQAHPPGVSSEAHWLTTVASGIDPRIDEPLAHLLALVRDGMPFAVFGSFKHCTRNPRKLYSVIEFIVGHGGAFVTPNYFISDGHVCRRRSLLRPAHFTDGVVTQLGDFQGTTRRRREGLAAASLALASDGE